MAIEMQKQYGWGAITLHKPEVMPLGKSYDLSKLNRQDKWIHKYNSITVISPNAVFKRGEPGKAKILRMQDINRAKLSTTISHSEKGNEILRAITGFNIVFTWKPEKSMPDVMPDFCQNLLK